MAQKLGIVLTPYGQIPGAPPWEIGYLYGGDGTYLCPEDELHNTRGEEGLYPDTQLGRAVLLPGEMTKTQTGSGTKLLGLGRGIPTDAELASMYGYVPMINGSVTFKEGVQPGTWIPPNGWNPAGAYGPQFRPVSLSTLKGLGDDASSMPSTPVINTTSGPIYAVPTSTSPTTRRKIDWLLVLTTASTAGVLISTVFSIVLQLRRIKKG